MALRVILSFIFGIFALIIAGTMLLLYYFKVYKKEIKIKRNTIAFNMLPEFTQGNAMLLEQHAVKTKSGRYICFGYAVDEEDGKEPQLRSVVVGKNSRILLGRGEMSKEKEIAIYQPRDLTAMTRKFKGTTLGDALDKSVTFGNILDNYASYEVEGKGAITDIVRRLGKGRELSREEVTKLSEFVNQFAKFREAVTPKKEEEHQYPRR
jgi:hypothetical protein